MIRLRGDIIFENPESRIREYCAVEIYQGYDDKHDISDFISQRDIDAANRLYSMIDRYDKTESRRLQKHGKIISNLLASIPNKDIFAFTDKEWAKLKSDIKNLFAEFLSIRGITLAKATKILHLKRPNLFPVLDSFVIRFLLDIDVSNVEKSRQVDIGLKALQKARKIITDQQLEFRKLVEQTSDLPIPLTSVRMFDILCWTAEKWDILGKLSAPYGIPSKSLLSLQESEEKQVRACVAEEKATLLPFQKEAILKIKRACESRERVLLSLSPGLGKSFIIFCTLSDLLRTRKIKRALIVTTRKVLLESFFDKLSEKPWQISTKQLSLSTRHSRSYLERRFKDISVFLSLLTMFSKEVPKFPSDFFDMIILDECHLFSAEDWEVVRRLDATIVGLTSIHPLLIPELLNSLGLQKPTYSYGITSLKLKEIADVFLGANYSSADLVKIGSCEFIRPRDVRNSRILEVKTFISETFARKNQKSILTEGDILLQNIFDFSRTAIVERKDLPAIASRNFFIIRSRKVNPEFLFDYLQSETIRTALQDQLEKLAHGFIKHVNLRDVREIDIPIPYSDKDMENFLIVQPKRGTRVRIKDLERARDGIRQLRLVYQKQKDFGD